MENNKQVTSNYNFVHDLTSTLTTLLGKENPHKKQSDSPLLKEKI